MTSKWLEMCLTVPDEAVDLVAQKLVEIGSTGITAAEISLDTFVVPHPDSLANDPILKAYFALPERPEVLCVSVQESLAELSGIYPELANIKIDYRLVDDEDWANSWRQHFPPFKVGRHLVIRPSWAEWQAADDETVLTLDPGQAFGTGTHATTSLCLDALADHFTSDSPPARILDVGTGSGILAMAGAALGAREVLATDIDSEACQVAQGNITRNRLEHAIKTTDVPLEELKGEYELVLANILAAENIRLAGELVAHLAIAGRLVLSGILIEQEQQVIDGFSSFPLTLLYTTHRDEWSCIVYQRNE